MADDTVTITTDQGTRLTVSASHPLARAGGGQADTPEEPPEGGPGSGRQAWADYATHPAVGVDVDEDMSRDDIVEAVRSR